MTDLERLRQQALADIAAVDADLAAFRALRSDHDDDEHDPDGSPLSAEWSRLESLRQAAAARLAGLDDAIRRDGAGTYGVCERCGRVIPPGRLEVQPTATRCVDCADRRR
ncbi:molecular chaperone DnaK [Nakamurella sp. YIM 132087]|uniref:Molecular chaperone DnaK n=1 Tax=Nakamurella alba TaxID=2665158 RepID=A0A7K1FS71_9ACTN|nr:TraR/DksA C4-type zinc finger protein [Nakamurella alba]MTD16920.1 molecular chaperone DnaK [Nakamurella alba]